MKRISVLILIVLMLLTICGCNVKDYPYKASFKELGVPLSDYYTTGGVHRSVWDIEAYNGKVYVGGGDYDKNKGPVMVKYYDVAKKEWVSDGNLPDEQIERFYIFNDMLYAAGCDPKENWQYGNFYTTNGNGWTTERVLPGGIHNFDLAFFDGKIFAGMGVAAGQFPVAVSSDGKSFSQVPFKKEGKVLSHTAEAIVRVYDFFTLSGELYAYLFTLDRNGRRYDVYRYDGESFVYHSDLISQLDIKRNAYTHINQKAEFNGMQFIARGHLYSTSDMKTADLIEIKPNNEILDLRVIDDTLYVLCNEKLNRNDKEEFRISVWYTNSGRKGSFRELFFFDYENRALSFTYDDGIFYFGIGYGITAKADYETNGMVLSVKNELE